MKLSAQQQAVRLHLYGLVRSLSYVVRLNDLKTAHPPDLAKPLQGDLRKLFEISGLWVRNVGNRQDLKLQIRRLIRRIVGRVKVKRRTRRPLRRRLT